ncbi:MAG: phosphatidate cytidylyltransferase [Candidatus Omnitrophica bacterium]|nr:phosphatidate cytidylyltransferase [Candidatus Omnitrophota bacterium]
MLKNRIITSAILIIISITAIFFELPSALILTILIVASLYEFFTMLQKKGIGTYKYFGTLMGAVIPLSITFRFELTKGWELLFMVLGFLFLILMQFKRKSNSGAIADISATIFGIFYISWFLSFLIKIRYMPGGLGLLAALLLITKSGDIGAYLIGSRFGRTPFIPRISPKKSVEGAFGGLAFSILAALVSKPLLNLSYPHVILIGIGLNVLAQLGDLSESLMKRDCEVKDSGSALPGMGGFLDLMDSFLFSAPCFYFYMNIVLKSLKI